MGFFKLATQLARYTGNTTFITEAEKEWDWFTDSVLYDDSDPNSIKINDGTDDLLDCKEANHAQYSYNYGITLAGLAYIYNHVRLSSSLS